MWIFVTIDGAEIVLLILKDTLKNRIASDEFTVSNVIIITKHLNLNT